MPLDLYRRTIERAAKLAGGEAQLALHLKVAPREVKKWIKGDETPPLAVFFAASQVIRNLSAKDLE